MFARIIIALSLISSVAAAQPTLQPVRKTTAEQIIADRQLVCTYGKTRFETDPTGRLVVIMGKVCTERSGKR